MTLNTTNLVDGWFLDAVIASKVMHWGYIQYPSVDWYIDRGWTTFDKVYFAKGPNGVVRYDNHGYRPFRPSYFIEDAWEVVEELNKMGATMTLMITPESFMAYVTKDGKFVSNLSDGPTMPIAICRVALNAVERLL